jgi:glucosamine--fructose-6-phosphate aminotransferase (isomerizing)
VGSGGLKEAFERVGELGHQLAALTSSAVEGARQWARRLAESTQVVFLGAGPNWATAQFGMAKLMEAASRPASARELEEWAHLEYFVTTRDSEVVICAPDGACLSRAEELWREVEFLGASSTVITQDPNRFSSGHRTRVFTLPKEVGEPYTPLLCATPLALGAYWLATSLDRRSYNFSSPEQEREHYQTLHYGLMADGRPLPH